MTRKFFALLFLLPAIAFSDFVYYTKPDGKINTIDLQENGTVHYIYENDRLVQIIRESTDEEILYTHTYNYNDQGYITSEDLIGNLGQIRYEADFDTKTSIITSPYHYETCQYNDKYQLIKHTQDGVIKEYQYNKSDELILNDQETQTTCEYNAYGNLIKTIDPTRETTSTRTRCRHCRWSGCRFYGGKKLNEYIERRNRPPDPDPRAGGRPHTKIEVPGKFIQNSTFSF